MILLFLGLFTSFILPILFFDKISKYFLELEKKNNKNEKVYTTQKEMKRALKNMLSFERYVDMNNIIDEL